MTLHHNLFDGTGQRTPRVRFGQVHIYNNYYKIINNPFYTYAWGVGIASQIYAENNAFTTDQKISAANLITVFRGTMIYETGTRINGALQGDLWMSWPNLMLSTTRTSLAVLAGLQPYSRTSTQPSG